MSDNVPEHLKFEMERDWDEETEELEVFDADEDEEDLDQII